jgi:hypothetical protein
MIALGNAVRGQTGHGILGKLNGRLGRTTKFGVSLSWRIFPLHILTPVVYRVCVAVPVVTTGEPEDPPDGLVCDLHTDPYPNGALLSSTPIGVLRRPRSARGTRSFVG